MSKLLDFTKFTSLSNWSVSHLLDSQFQYNKNFKLEKIRTFLKRNKTQILVDDDIEYKRVTIKLYNKGVLLRDKEYGRNIGTKKQFIIEEGQFLLSKIDARNGAFGLATKEVDNAIITADFFAYNIDRTKIEPYFLVLLTTTKKFQNFAQSSSSGTTGRQRIDENKFLDVQIPLPTLEEQRNIVNSYKNKIELSNNQILEFKKNNLIIKNYLIDELGITQNENNKKIELLHFLKYSAINKSWSYSDLLNLDEMKSKYELKYLKDISFIIMGNSPKSSDLNDVGEGYQFIGGASDIKNETIISKRYIKSSNKITLKNDILYLVRATIGKPFIVNDSYFLGRGVCAIRANENLVSNKYLLNILELFENEIIAKAKGSTFKQISKPDLENLEIPIPNLEVQNKLCNFIDNIKEQNKELKKRSILNKLLSLEEFEREIFNEA